MTREEQISEAYKDVENYVKPHIDKEGWIPHRYLLELLSLYEYDEIEKIEKKFVRPKILRL